ncbi:MAG: phosphoenolpyruvate--protein phosphotransferase [Pirellulales bacterium]
MNPMLKFTGVAVSAGVAIGEALVLTGEGFRIPRQFVSRDAVDAELQRLDAAFRASAREITENRDNIAQQLGPRLGAIFDAHLQMLDDPALRSEIDQHVRERRNSPEYAVSQVLRRYVKVFRTLPDKQFAARADDILDLEKRLMRNLLGQKREELSELTSPVLVLAHNLTPSETASLNRQFVLGFVTEIGGVGSHTAIVAQGMEIPAVVGVGSFLTDVSGGDQVIIDGNAGLVIVCPDEPTLERYRQEAESDRTLAARLQSLRDLPAETADGTRIDLLGNIEFPQEVKQCCERGSDGIGLYRTEFLYLGTDEEPTEETHYNAYRQVIDAMGGRPVVIRTLDLGADKMRQLPQPEDEHNPCLGLRSIRISLRNVPLFRTQLRAILRASASGNVRILFPLISTLHELRQAKMILADVMEDLEENNVPFNRQMPVGMMVEVPSAVILIDQFVPEVEFISIGTNDLVQYTLAVDRGNMEVAGLYNSCDPAVLRMIKLAIDAGRSRAIGVNVCGQMSGNPTYTMLLLGLGLRQLSVTPSAIPEIKKVCRSVTLPQCEAVAARVINMEHARDIKHYLKEELRKVLPERAG